MTKKRLIFVLLYSDGYFMLSRNFRLQKVGNLSWLKTNYNFSQISKSIDELIVLNVTRGEKKFNEFCTDLKSLTQGCFVPISAGGGIRTIQEARNLLRAGADKVVVNSILFENNDFIASLASEFGQQCLVAAMDIKVGEDGLYQIWSESGSKYIKGSAKDWVHKIAGSSIGEIYINSIDRDGTGQGYDLNILSLLPKDIMKPIILSGGVGNATHLLAGISDFRVDAVATANLFNFVGDGLKHARQSLIDAGVELPLWDIH